MVRKMIVLASNSDVPVLIMGPTGSGKEKVAQLIHEYSEQRNHHLITVNCGAIPGNLLESELFGHVKGAFTGATADKIGKWQLADHGTLFLDEIGDMLPAHQVKLLRALENSIIQRVGGTADIKVNARIIAATNKILFTLVNNNQFREDLFYRLQQFKIRTPAITSNADDLDMGAVINHFDIRTAVRQVMSADVDIALICHRSDRMEAVHDEMLQRGQASPEMGARSRRSVERILGLKKKFIQLSGFKDPRGQGGRG